VQFLNFNIKGKDEYKINQKNPIIGDIFRKNGDD